MKLYSDEEANYLCRDFRDIPFELRQILFGKTLDDNHISQFNPAGKKKKDFSTPANINMFSEAIGDNYGIDSKHYREEYNKIYDKNVKNKFDRVMQDRKRDDEIAQYENIVALLRKPNASLTATDRDRRRTRKINELTELAGVDLSKTYSELIITNNNGNVMDMNIEKLEKQLLFESKLTKRKNEIEAERKKTKDIENLASSNRLLKIAQAQRVSRQTQKLDQDLENMQRERQAYRESLL